ncbi:MAG: succinate dehydrogenase [Phycisphaerales bacterium]|nr:succinate dehydrogenase [Phycisphaerales bacterium]
MSQGVNVRLPQIRKLGETSRTDNWWIQPLLVFLGFATFIVYSTWAAFQGKHFAFDGAGAHYLSPFYSPLLWDPPGMHSGHAWFGEAPSWLLSIWPPFMAFSPALLILWAPGGFRFTCYYYRGAYYKAFWADPINCSVGEPGFRKEKYRGEKKFPLILQNVHRYFLYLALAFLVLLAWDAIHSFMFTDPVSGGNKFGIGIGTLVLTINPILLGGYTLGCHSFRHLIGGRKNEMGDGIGKKAYDCSSCLNRRHMLWAWMSLFWVGFTDVYVRLCSMGIWTDYRLI